MILWGPWTAVTATAATLLGSSLINVLQTVRVGNHGRISNDQVEIPASLQDLIRNYRRAQILQLYLQCDCDCDNTSIVATRSTQDSYARTDDRDTSISSRSRSRSYSRNAPHTRPIIITEKELQGEWNGQLLDNNGLVMTTVSKFLTHQLFGRGNRWNGKSFDGTGKGCNRFVCHSPRNAPDEILPPRRSTKPSSVDQVEPNKDTLPQQQQQQYTFDYEIIPGGRSPALLQATRDQKNPPTSTIVLDYKRHQHILSPWYSMRDELRYLRLGDNQEVLLGMGCMAWSGGMWNASPFVLWRDRSA